MSGYKPSGVTQSSDYVEYPKWLYHKELPAKLVQSEEEHVALGMEWRESTRAEPVQKDEVLPREVGFIEFPKWKYHLEGEALIVSSELEEEELGDGWFDTPMLARAARFAPQDPENSTSWDSMTKEELSGIATALGIEVKSTWGTKRLIQAIEAEKSPIFAA